MRIARCELPTAALLQKYSQTPAYTDCYMTRVPGRVSYEDFVRAFYTTALFKTERALLKWFAGRPSTDADANVLATGAASQFAAWRVEDRAQRQILLADFTGRTRSWLMTQAIEHADGSGETLLYFGSAVVPAGKPGTGEAALGVTFSALLGFHKLYSRLLLGAARRRALRATQRNTVA